MEKIEQEVKFSIKLKFFIVIASIILFISTSLVSFFLVKTKRGLENEIEKRGLSEVKSLAYDAKYGVLIENKSIVDDIITGRLEKPDIVYVEIVGENEKNLARRMKKEYAGVLFSNDKMPILELGEGIYRSSLSGEKGEKVYEFVAPILAERSVTNEYEDEFETIFMMGETDEKRQTLRSRIGTVKIGISLKNVREQIVENFFISVVIIFLVVTVSIVVSIFFINIIVRPIREVAQTAMEISEGDLSKTVDVKSSDEIGIMADNFNRMTESLRNTIKELKELKNGLELEVEKRTEDLKQAHKGLVKAYDDLKNMDEMKTNFLSSVSHELRTPLTSVMGFASNAHKFYKKDIKPELPTDNKKLNKRSITIEKNLNIIISEAERLTRLINDVLDIAKMEAGKIEWNIQELNIIDICQQVLSIVAGYPKSSQVEILFEGADDIMPVKGDLDRIIQVITNLMSNALKFTEKGKIILKVEPFENHVRVSVSDSGKGMHENDVPEIFEKFRQMGDTLIDKPKGTGLGLPICKEIIEHLGGRIWAESEVGKGSRFYFTINYYSAEKEKLIT